MIKEERLKELIRQHAIIYTSGLEKIELDDNYVIEHNDIKLSDKSHHTFVVLLNEKTAFIKEISQLFETEELAKWFLDMTRTRVQTLRMPLYETFKETNRFEFISYDNQYIVLSTNGRELAIDEYNADDYIQTYFRADDNKENYFNACYRCLDLFEGKDVDREGA